MRVGNFLGKAIKIDDIKMETSRDKFAQIYIEINLKNPFISLILISGHNQTVEYERRFRFHLF